jgi:hypothetical protein
MKSTPQEIDDLLNIAAVTMIKLYKIAPKDYKRIIGNLFNNGGMPSVSAATDAAQSTVQRKPPAEKPMKFYGDNLDPNNPDEANLIKAMQKAQANEPKV